MEPHHALSKAQAPLTVTPRRNRVQPILQASVRETKYFHCVSAFKQPTSTFIRTDIKQTLTWLQPRRCGAKIRVIFGGRPL